MTISDLLLLVIAWAAALYITFLAINRVVLGWWVWDWPIRTFRDGFGSWL